MSVAKWRVLLLGAVCVGLLLVPAVGLVGAAVALALIKAVSLVGLVLACSGSSVVLEHGRAV